MKRIFLVAMFIWMSFLPSFAFQSDEDMDIARAQDYTNAVLKKTPVEKIEAFKEYLRKYPDTSQKFTRLAYYMLTINHFYNNDYKQTISTGEKAIGLGELPRGEEARLYLVVGNAYGIKNTAFYNQDKALEYTNRAIALARGTDSEVLKTAQELKNKLSGPPPKNLTPEQKIKMQVYQNEDYNGAISYYRSLGATDKNNSEIYETYATALLKANRLDDALKEFSAGYSKNKKGKFAKGLAEIYSKKTKTNKSFIDESVKYYIEAAVLFRKEGNSANYNAALQLAKYQYFEKYNFNAKINKYNAEQQKSKSSKDQNEAEIARLERELRKHERYLRQTYENNDLDPPFYEVEKGEKLEKRISQLKSGGTAENDVEGQKLLDEKKKIEKEFDEKVKEISKKI